MAVPVPASGLFAEKSDVIVTRGAAATGTGYAGEVPGTPGGGGRLARRTAVVSSRSGLSNDTGIHLSPVRCVRVSEITKFGARYYYL